VSIRSWGKVKGGNEPRERRRHPGTHSQGDPTHTNTGVGGGVTKEGAKVGGNWSLHQLREDEGYAIYAVCVGQ